MINEGHDEHFGTRIHVVHRRAMAMLGVGALELEEGYRQRQFVVEEDDCRDERQRRRRGMNRFKRSALSVLSELLS